MPSSSTVRALENAVRLHEVAVTDHERGALPSADRAARRALALFQKHSGRAHPDVANVLLLLSRLATAHARNAAAQTLAERAVRILRGVAGDDADLERLRIKALMELAACHRQQAHWSDAARTLRRALARAEAAFGMHDLDVAMVLNELGVIDKYRARFREASSHYRRAVRIVARHPDDDVLATLEHNLGGLEHARGRFARAEPHARRAVALREALLGRTHPIVAQDLAALAAILAGRGKRREARAMYRRALRIFERALGPDHYEVAFNQANLAALLQTEGDLDEAEALYRRSIEVRAGLLGARHADLALPLYNLGVLLLQRGDRRAALPLVERALRIGRRALGARHPHVQAFGETLAALRPAARSAVAALGR